MLPSDVAAVLPASIDRDHIQSYARLHAAIDSPLGESHLVAAGGRVFAVTRRSPFDPFQLVELAAAGVRYEESSFTRKLTLTTLAGPTHVMDVSILDVTALQAFVKSLDGKTEAAPPPVKTEAAPPPVKVVKVTEDRGPMRAKLLGVMKQRASRAEPAPFPGYERYIAPTAHLPRVRPPTPEPRAAEPAAVERPRKKKKKKKPHVDQPHHEARHESETEADGPLFRTWHWIALLVVAPLIFLAFMWYARRP